MEVPRRGVKSELQLPPYATATAMPDPSHVCDLHHSSRQRRIPNPQSKDRDRTCILMDPTWVVIAEPPRKLEKWVLFFWVFLSENVTVSGGGGGIF